MHPALPALLLTALVLAAGCTSSQQLPAGDTTDNRNTPQGQQPSQQQPPPAPPAQLARSYYRYEPQALEQAQREGKAVFLFFRANWCPLCNVQRPKILDALNSLQYDDVAGFEAHYNDDETTAADTALAQQYQVPYQDTKIFLKKDGSVSLKSQAHLEKEQVRAEIAKARSG